MTESAPYGAFSALCASAGIFLFAVGKAKIPSRGSRKIPVREFIRVRTRAKNLYLLDYAAFCASS